MLDDAALASWSVEAVRIIRDQLYRATHFETGPLPFYKNWPQELELFAMHTKEAIDNAVSILSIDAAIFSLKEKPRTENELSKLMEETIGAYGTDGNLYTCCTETASEFGACDYNYLGFLIVQKNAEGVGFKNTNIVTVEHRKMDIFVGGENKEFNFGAMAIDFVDESEHMVHVFANCDDPSIGSVRIHGKVIWVSYVSGITVPLYLVLACFHVLLAIWYK